MKYFYTFLLTFILLPLLVQAQNLVPNPSFEDTTLCPTGINQMNSATGWYAARATPEYFHSCANNNVPIVGVPDNFPGYQYPFNGQAYAGIISYWFSNGGYREHIGVPILQPLQIGTEYFVSAYFSRGDSIYMGDLLDCATNKLGFRFSNNSYNALSFDYSPIDNFAHIYTNDIIYDSINWIQISGSFIADSAYTYLLIGNFFDEANISTNSCFGTAYYYIDNVCVSTSPNTCNIINSSSSIEQQALISFYPNPANSFLSVKNLKSVTEYSLLNSNGIIIRQGIVSDSENFIPVSDLPNGLFIVRLNNNTSHKFFISR